MVTIGRVPTDAMRRLVLASGCQPVAALAALKDAQLAVAEHYREAPLDTPRQTSRWCSDPAPHAMQMILDGEAYEVITGIGMGPPSQSEPAKAPKVGAACILLRGGSRQALEEVRAHYMLPP